MTLSIINTATDREHDSESEMIVKLDRLERAINGSSIGLWEWDLLTDQVWYSPRFLELLDFTSEEFPEVIESWQQQLHPEDAEHTWSEIENHIRTGKTFESEYRLAKKSGEYRWFHSQGVAYRNNQGQPVLMAGSIQDIDDLKRTEQMLDEKEAQLIQQQKLDAMGSLAGGIAHEFNNLLQAITGYSAFAQESLAPDSQAYRDIEQALTAAGRATMLTRQLLNFSRNEVANARDGIVDDIVWDLEALLRPLLPENIHFHLNLNASNTPVCVDPQLTEQALLNLCINARDAMPNGGPLLVSTQAITVNELASEGFNNISPGQYVQIQVTDTGTGIPEEIQQRIFEPFFSTKEVGKGTGLGLSMVFGVVQQFKGQLQIHSNPDQGTTVRIYFPVSKEPTMASEILDMNYSSGGETLLLAEDDPLVCEVGRRMLEKGGYKVITASNGEEALDLFILHAHEIDLVLMDIVMPRLTGREVFEHIRRLNSSVPICFCTGYDPAAAQSESLRSMGCDVLQKPFLENDLLSSIRKTLNGEPADQSC